jgi:hypothetical protein
VVAYLFPGKDLWDKYFQGRDVFRRLYAIDINHYVHKPMVGSHTRRKYKWFLSTHLLSTVGISLFWERKTHFWAQDYFGKEKPIFGVHAICGRKVA